MNGGTMSYGLDEGLAKVLLAVGISKEEALSIIRETAVKYPESAQRAAALEALITQYVTPALDPASLKATLAGIAKDIAGGMTGVDPNAWSTSV